MSTAWQTVHVRVNDAATGRPTPVRIRFTGPDGTYYAPFGRLTEFATGYYEDVGGNLLLGDQKYAYIDSTCEIRLPVGPVLVEIQKGPEYRPHRQEVALAAGKMSLRFDLERWIDLRRDGWYSGDIRAYGLTPHAALLEAAAEDLAVVNLLASECTRESRLASNYTLMDDDETPLAQIQVRTVGFEVPPEVRYRVYRAIPNITAFSGQKPALETPGHLVVVNTQNSHPILGSLALLNCHRPVYPLSFGGPDGSDDWTLADWCDQCHRKSGLVVWTKQFEQSGSGISHYGEPLADLVLGKVDALDCGSHGWNLAHWYDLLNAGLRLPVVAGSAKVSNMDLLGKWRTYARLLPGADFTYPNWIEAIRAGRTFITKGPLLTFTVAGKDSGATIEAPAVAPTVHVRAEARSLDPFAQVQILANGTVVAETSPVEATPSAIVETDVVLPAGGWIAARCWGPSPAPEHLPRAPTSPGWGPPPSGLVLRAHTSPVYVHVEGRPRRADPQVLATLVDDLDGMLAWVQQEARCETEPQRERLANTFRSARQELLR